MGVYVDQARISYRGMKMSHMVADTEAELHAMADKLGIRREWFHLSNKGVPHYNICEANRLRAVSLGAKLVARKELVTLTRGQRRQ